MLILGVNMFHADASAAIVMDGEVKFAIAEERLNRRKHFGGFPALAVRACLDAVGAKILMSNMWPLDRILTRTSPKR
jgi:carbamoyltransferase